MRWDGKIYCNNSDDEMKYNCGNHVAEEDYKTDEDGEDTQTIHGHGEKRLFDWNGNFLNLDCQLKRGL